MAKKNHSITVGFISLGCPKNVVDSERMLAEIVQAGFLITPESYNADVIVVNTCAFIAPAQAESLDAIKQAVDCKADPRQKVGKVIVAGCLPERMGEEIFRQIEGIDAVISLDNRDDIAKVIRKVLSLDQPAPFFEKSHELAGSRILDDRTRLLITPGHWAYDTCNPRPVQEQAAGTRARRGPGVSFGRCGRIEYYCSGYHILRTRFENR